MNPPESACGTESANPKTLVTTPRLTRPSPDVPPTRTPGRPRLSCALGPRRRRRLAGVAARPATFGRDTRLPPREAHPALDDQPPATHPILAGPADDAVRRGVRTGRQI